MQVMKEAAAEKTKKLRWRAKKSTTRALLDFPKNLKTARN